MNLEIKLAQESGFQLKRSDSLDDNYVPRLREKSRAVREEKLLCADCFDAWLKFPKMLKLLVTVV